MTTIMGEFIRQPSLTPGERTAVIVICPRLLGVTGSLDLALQRSELEQVVDMDQIVDQFVVSPTLFHELFHVAAGDGGKRFLVNMA
jgi:hypothetical protein